MFSTCSWWWDLRNFIRFTFLGGKVFISEQEEVEGWSGSEWNIDWVQINCGVTVMRLVLSPASNNDLQYFQTEGRHDRSQHNWSQGSDYISTPLLSFRFITIYNKRNFLFTNSSSWDWGVDLGEARDRLRRSVSRGWADDGCIWSSDWPMASQYWQSPDEVDQWGSRIMTFKWYSFFSVSIT